MSLYHIPNTNLSIDPDADTPTVKALPDILMIIEQLLGIPSCAFQRFDANGMGKRVDRSTVVEKLHSVKKTGSESDLQFLESLIRR